MVNIHVDVDNLWVYEQEYGISFGQQPGFIFENALPRFLDVLARHNVRVTFFIVGKDLEFSAAQRFCREAIRRGHAIANHTYTHPISWRTMSALEKRGEIQRCHDAIVSVTGQRPIGFRAPGYYIDRDTIDILGELEYVYDSSVLPGYANYFMRAYMFLRGEGARSKVFGRSRYLFASRHPRRLGYGPGRHALLELPISVVPFVRSPSHTTFLYPLGRPYLTLMKALYRLAPVDHVYLLHAIDVVDVPCVAQSAQRVIPLRQSFGARQAFVGELLTFFRAIHGAPIVTTEFQAQDLRARSVPLSRILSFGPSHIESRDMRMGVYQDVAREPRPRITAHRVRVAILAIVIGLAALEAGSYIVLRFVFRVPMERGGNKPIPHIWLPSDGRLPFRMKTNHEERHHTDEFDTTIRLNNVGMREDIDYTGEHVNIGVVGDSFTFGWGVNVGERYSDVLRTFFPDQLIRSYGYFAGLAPPHYYIFLKYHPEYIPDTLILGLLPVNDLDIDMRDTLMHVDAHGEPVAASLTLRYVTADGALGAGRDPESVSPFLRPLVTSYTGKLFWLGKQQLTSKWNQEWRRAGSRDGAAATALQAVHRDALSYVTRLRDLVRAKGGTMIVFLIPVERELIDNPSPIWEPVKAWLRDHDVAFIDPVEAFVKREREGEQLYYKKDGHWNANGHRLAAALIADYIRRSGHRD